VPRGLTRLPSSAMKSQTFQLVHSIFINLHHQPWLTN
jgi:hypothetical protein